MRNMIWILVMLAFSSPALVVAAPGVIAVQGSAERGIEPDMLRLQVEIWSQAKTAKAAQQAAAGQFQSLQKSIAAEGLPKEDVQTQNYSLTPDYEYNQKTQKNQMVGFRVSQTLQITLRKVETAGAFLDKLSAGSQTSGVGVNIQNVQWSSSQKEKIQGELLTEAVQAAKKQADILAKASGTKIQALRRLQPADVRTVEPQMERTFAMKASDSAPGTELSSGQVKVKVEISAEYEVK